MSAAVRVVVLAAGASRRLGRPKALVRLSTGESLLTRAVNLARTIDAEPIITVSSDAQDVIVRCVRRACVFLRFLTPPKACRRRFVPQVLP
jgi:choline kinase